MPHCLLYPNTQMHIHAIIRTHPIRSRDKMLSQSSNLANFFMQSGHGEIKEKMSKLLIRW